MNILFHRPTPWSNNINCSTKTYSKLFAKSGHCVTYLQTSINLLHWITRKGYYKTWKEGSRFSENIWVACALSLLPYYDKSTLFSKKIIRFSYKFCFPSIRRLVLKSGFGEPDIIWTTVPGSSVLKEIFPNSQLIFHCIDNYAAYRGNQVTKIEAQDYKKSDHIFVIGEVLKKHVLSLNTNEEKITNLGQGVNIDLYQKDYKIPEDIKNIAGPIAIWVGVLEKFDTTYLEIIAKTMKKRGGSVVLLGPITKSFTNLFTNFNNVFFLGSKSSKEVPKYLLHCDIGLMPYNRTNQEIYKGQHPLKLYEYAAAKLPIISTWNDEYETLKPPVLLVNQEKDIEKAIYEALDNANFWKEKVFDFAINNTWENCKNKAEKIIFRLTNKTIL
jgi:glycosyltransferase involved in cell wall biosynthesis